MSGKISDNPAFRSWFAASKVVDTKGNPLIVYHGSPDLRFLKKEGVFKSKNQALGFEDKNPSFYFTDSYSKAKSYSDERHAFDYQNAEGGVLQFYLSIQNPLMINAAGSAWRKYETEIDGVKLTGTKQIVSYAQQKGFDGVIVKNVKDYYNNNDHRNSTGAVYVAFHPEQIKLADGTNTTFEIGNPDIRYEDGGLIAPNGKQSNLTPEQYKLVRSKSFKKWFGDWENSPETASKVVDQNGEPLVVYHGTPKNKFFTFDIKIGSKSKSNMQLLFGSHFASNFDDAKIYAKQKGHIYSVFLYIKNILDLSEHYNHDNPKFNSVLEIIKELKIDKKFKRSIDYEFFTENGDYGGVSDKIQRVFLTQFMLDSYPPSKVFDCIKKRFDGIAYIPYQPQGFNTASFYSKSFICFHPEQIKLADGTNTTFDSNNPDIRYDNGGKIPQVWYRKYNGNNPFLINENGKYKYGKGLYFSSLNDSRFDGDNSIEVNVEFKNPKVFESTKTIPNINFIKGSNKDIDAYSDRLFEKHDAIIVKHSAELGDELIIRDTNQIKLLDIRYNNGEVVGKVWNLEEFYDWSASIMQDIFGIPMITGFPVCDMQDVKDKNGNQSVLITFAYAQLEDNTDVYYNPQTNTWSKDQPKK